MLRRKNRSDGLETDPARSTVLMVALVVVALPSLLIVWWGASKIFDSTSTTHYQAAKPVQRVVLDTGDMNVQIRESAVTAVTIDTKSTYFLDKPDVKEQVDSGALLVKADCGSGWTLTACDTDMTVVVPKGVSVSLDGGQGDVSMFDLTGKVAVKAGSGDVSGLGLDAADVLALTSTGDVSLDMAQAPVSLDVSTDSGDIDVVVPSTTYAVDLKSENGDAELSGLTNDASSVRSIRTVSDVGDVTVSGRSIAATAAS
jgi:DUF4097 and DUF4098 domain-containing protein YvlB